jgi:hypothetical protein
MANQRMATTSNKGLGQTPSWTDNLQFIIYGNELSIKVLVSDRLASHDSSSENQIFVTANIDLTRFLDRGHARGTFSNWYDLMCDGKIIGALHLMFDFQQRTLTETESAFQGVGGLSHQFDYVYEQWANHSEKCAWHQHHAETF